MLNIIKIDIPRDSIDFARKIASKFTQIQPKNFTLQIENVPTMPIALELILQNWFKSEINILSNLIAIVLKISENIDEKFNDNQQLINLTFKEPILICFQSTVGGCDSKIFWKMDGCTYSVFIDKDKNGEICTFCNEFLTTAISGNKSGILQQFSKKSRIKLHEIGTNNGQNLLSLAISNNHPSLVQKLIQHEFNVDAVIDQAWNMYTKAHDNPAQQQNANKIVMALFKANSTFPKDFEYSNASKEMQEFADMCLNLHENVNNNDFAAIELTINEYPKLCHFYNLKNESLVSHALKSKKFEILKLLKHGISIGCHEDLDEIYENMEEFHRIQLRSINKSNALEYPEMHLIILRIKSRIGIHDQFSQNHWKFIDEAFGTLNKNEYCSKILQIAALSQKLNIIFDMNNDTSYYMDPTASYPSKGIIHENGTIFIGAKDLTDDNKKYEIFGVLAHELCHYAVYTAFMNRNFDPFPVGDSVQKARYINQVMVQCRKLKNNERIVSNVFKCYADNEQASELIVAVPQMLMMYLKHPKQLKRRQKIFKNLFKYSKDVVESEFDAALPILKMLEDPKQSLTFDDLTEPMKAKILHSKLTFQGHEASFFDVIGHDTDILKCLTAKRIRDVLLHNKSLIIGTDMNVVHNMTLRTFYDNKMSKKEPKSSINYCETFNYSSIKTITEIRENYKNSKVFILADHAGTGKTTFLKYYSAMLKSENVNFWVSFINLRYQSDIFKAHDSNNLNLNTVLDILSQFVDNESKVEENIFKNLFLNGKVILMLDGVDEVCPKYKDIVMDMLNILNKSETNNELWISTRPHYSQQLSDIFCVPAFRFVPFTKMELEGIVLNILDQKGKTSIEDKTKYVTQFMDIFWTYSVMQSSNIFMINMIAGLCIDELIDYTSTSMYGLFEVMIHKQKSDFGSKIHNENCDLKVELTIWKVYTIFSLLLLIGDEYEAQLGFKLSELDIMTKWIKEQHLWTSDVIQRYGFLNVDLKSNSIDFMHRIYAEYFVAEYLIKFIFDDNKSVSDEEIGRKFKLFELVLSKQFRGISSFIFTYVEIDAKFKELSYCPKIKDLIIKAVKRINVDIFMPITDDHKSIYNFTDALDSFKSYTSIVQLDNELSSILWHLNQQDSVFHQIIRSRVAFDLNLWDITLLAQLCFGPNWHERFNKSGINLITDEELDKFEHSHLWPVMWKNDKNLLKFCDLIDKNYNLDDKMRFYSNQFRLKLVYNQNIWKEVFARIKNSIDIKSYAVLIMGQPNYYVISIEMLIFIHKEVEEIFGYEKAAINELLFKDLCWTSSPLGFGLDSKNHEIFSLTINFYNKYKNSNDDLKELLMICDEYHFIRAIKSELYKKFKEYIQTIFGHDISKIAEKFETFFKEKIQFQFYFDISEKYLENFNDFLNFIFCNDEQKIKALINGKYKVSQYSD
ncbi:uncharacterized protein [Chironomus tepperi]|uniref:uncharacterized protein n=1 Tax=Chironomus tepperi TaxID=113505 RepID=UPI00391EFFC9